MYANYNRFDPIKAIALGAHGIESQERICADLVNTPANYYKTPCTAYDPESQDNFLRVNVTETEPTIYNDPHTDPQLKAALAHRIFMETVSSLIDDSDRKFLSFICNAIVGSDLEVLKQLLNVISDSMPHKMEAYLKTLTASFNSLGAGICLKAESRTMVLVHLYHGNCAIAIDPTTSESRVMPIFTDWDGEVFVASGEVISPTSDRLLEKIQEQAVCRILMGYQKSGRPENKSQLPVVRDLAA